MKLIELRPDRALLKPNFDGYKLSLEPIPIVKTELTSKPDKIRPSDGQYSFLHAQLYGLQNHLVKDPWVAGTSYFIDTNIMVQKVQYDENNGRLKPPSAVFKIGSKRLRQEEDYNLCLQFISEKYGLISDGIGNLYLVDTGDRIKNAEWKSKYASTPLPDSKGFVIQDARFEIKNNERQIHCVLMCVEHDENAFETILHWVEYIQLGSDVEWRLKGRKALKGKGYPNYCSLEPKSTGIVISSDKPFKYFYDSENPVSAIPEKQKKTPDTAPAANQLFTWKQTDDLLSIKFNHKQSLKITNEDERFFLVDSNGDIVLDSDEFFAQVNHERTHWTKEDDKLDITFVKSDPGESWPFLQTGGPEEALEMIINPSKLSTLASHLEDCDFGVGGQEQEFTIERFDAATHETTHKIFLGNNPPLFNVCIRPGYPSAIVLRHDVDACLWLQNIPSTGDSSEWNLKHDGTLNAFGYVQASKIQKKFMQCSPDTNYAIICESERHVFIYKGNYNTASGLRNRNGPQVSIGQQKLVVLDSGEVLGIAVENDVTILLTESSIICLQLCIEE